MLITLVGNKSDMESQRRVDRADAETYAEEHGFTYVETSGKNGVNVMEVFQQLATRLCRERGVVKPETGLPERAAAPQQQQGVSCSWCS